MRIRFGIAVFFLLAALPALSQQPQLTRDQTRELLRATLTRYGQTALHTDFRQSDKQAEERGLHGDCGQRNAVTDHRVPHLPSL